MMDELGPFHAMDFGGTIYENVYAWNKVSSTDVQGQPDPAWKESNGPGFSEKLSIFKTTYLTG